jgi:hypothetical protein
MPKSTSQAVAVAMKDERSSAPRKHKMRGSEENHKSGSHTQKESKAVRLLAKKATKRKSEESSDKPWSPSRLDSSRLFEDGFKEDRHRQSEFHQELLRVRQDVAAAQLRRRKELAKQHLVFKIRAMQTAKHLDNGGLYGNIYSKQSTAVHTRTGDRDNVHSAFGAVYGLTGRSKSGDASKHSLSIIELRPVPYD